ncbi:uncharacterized protein C8Q71DRAFT_722360 [Rhodofomes roseus]|uniref:G-protein coupled receptors family 2 profile 2 domain-containing protein n=1 Tax=Rhodofomes roseus TaxID=34475 RepID=A0ABQ8KMA1_9APHY|nr:uncharacterized protein C8Q71DRAFT_722360 [Rhodofomes roseus]KAH9839442.1 hypothetical protein C8Q71DRAFT_722360 [Rhodofomes roseus]
MATLMAELQKIPGGDYRLLTKVTYSASEARGMAVEVAFAWLSAAACAGLLGALAISAWNTRKSVNPHLFVRSHVAAYFVSLLWCDLMQAFSAMLSVRWLNAGAVTLGQYCTYQGFLKQSADVSMAVWTLMIALHTFLVVFLRWSMRRRSLFVMLGIGWGFILLIVIIGPAGYKSNLGPFYGINGYYCWIASNYGNQRVVLDLLWLFMGAILSFVLYGLVFLNLRGNVTTSGIYFRRDSRMVRLVDEDSVAIAKQMLIYPIAFTILIFPMAIVRFVSWSGTPVTDAASTFGDTVFLMCGLVDVLLFVLTRRVLPDHSVIPKGYSLRFWSKKDNDGPPQRSISAPRPIIDLNADLEKADDSEKATEATLDEAVFKRADSPDDSEDDHNEVTIRVQSQVIDRIHLQPGYEGLGTPPGLSPQQSSRTAQFSGRMEEVQLDSSRGIRVPDQQRENEFFASDLPPLPPSAYTAYGSPAPGSAIPTSGRYVETPARIGTPIHSARYADEAPATAASAHTLRYHQDEHAFPEPPRSPRYATEEPQSIPSPARSPRFQQAIQIPEPDNNPRFAEEIVRHFEELPAATPLRSAFFPEEERRAPSPLHSARDNYARDESRVPTPLHSARTARYEHESERIPTPVQSARNAYAEATPPITSAAAPSSENPYRVDLSAPSPRAATPEVRSAQAGLSQYRCRSPLLSSHGGEPSPTDSSLYTESDDDEPFTSDRSARYQQYLGTPRSATFPSRNTPSSAREVNFPMSARLPAPSSKWPRY